MKELFPMGTKLEVVREGPYCILFRCSEEQRVLKVASEHRIDLEGLFYKLLHDYNIPSIKSERINTYVLSLEDLSFSNRWRLAEPDDVKQANIGEACATWYQAFHQAARIELKKNSLLKDTLRWEYDSLDKAKLADAGEALSLTQISAWNEAIDLAPSIIEYLSPKVDTLTYNDFNYVNLAISTKNDSEITIFDFDHSGIGIAEMDYKNVASGLEGPALEAFKSTVSINEKLWDCNEILALLYALMVASQREPIPRWSYGLIEIVKSEDFSKTMKKVEGVIV